MSTENTNASLDVGDGNILPVKEIGKFSCANTDFSWSG